jgi:protein-S-isoprenylcysteine O-methyltransferase Ste14
MSRLPTLGPRGEGWVLVQGVLFVLVAAAGWSLPGAVDPTIASALDLAGRGLVVGALVVALSASLLLRSRDAFTANPRPRPQARLVDHGPYRFVRHPIYAAIVLAGLGWALARASGVALLLDLVLLIFFDLKRRREEAWLVERVAGYAAYMRRTAALIPGVY